MKKTLFLWMFIIAGHAGFSQTSYKNYEDSVRQYFAAAKVKHPNTAITRALDDSRTQDSLKLLLYAQRAKYMGFDKDYWYVAKSIVDQGIVLEHLGADSTLILSKFREAYYYAQSHQDTVNLLWAAIRISKHYLNIGALNTPEELKYSNRVKQLLPNKNITREEKYLGYNYLANRYLRFYDFKTALDYYNQSYELAKTANDSIVITEVGANIISVYNQYNDTNGVSNLVREFEKQLPKRRYNWQGLFYLRLAGFTNLFPLEKRESYLQKADAFYKIATHKVDRNLLLISFCRYYYEVKNSQKMRKYLDQFRAELKITPATQQYYYTSQIELLEGQYYDLVGNYNKALELYHKSLAEAQDIDAPILLPTIYKEMYKTAAKFKDFERAYQYLTLYNKHHNAVFSLHKTKEIQDLIVHYEADKKQLTINSLQTEKALSEELLAEKNRTNFVLQIFITALALLSLILVYFYVLNRVKSKKLTQLNKLKDTVFSVLSHDLRSPLNTFKSLLVISSRKNLSTEQYKKYLEVIETEVSNTSMFLDNLLRWAQVNQNKHRVIKEEVNVCELLENVKTEINLDLRAKQTPIVTHCSLDVNVTTDPDLLGFIVRNIAFNAVKFSDKNAEVLITVTTNAQKTIVEIKDHGKGMSAQAVEDFYSGKLEASLDATGEKSTGLGLALCKEFAAKMGVRLSLKSKIGEGSIFTVEIPKEG